ncbi:hypothetical protein E2542_SST21556 [Spatholobus suberectus]|nr:hypothetical protein E2542_SST21556 [Spatholobus suberectus]
MDSKASGDVSKGEVPKPKENVGSGSEDKVMKAPGGDGSYISKKEFEKNPQNYSAGAGCILNEDVEHLVRCF